MRGVFKITLFRQLYRGLSRNDILEGRKRLVFTYSKGYCTIANPNLNKLDGLLVDKYIKYLSNAKSNNLDLEKLFEDYDKIQIKEICENLESFSEKTDEATQLTNMLKEYANDEEMKSLIDVELQSLRSEVTTLKDHILNNMMNPTTKMVDGDVVFEVSAGVGGQEAMLFTQEILQMYINYFNYKNWSANISSIDETELGGIRHATILVSGEDAYNRLKFEAGVHRVQRVPKTERGGRLHTSTMSVAVLLQPDEVKVNLNLSDLKIETCRASGKGGQHVNTTDSAVRIVHIPTGMVAECQTERSQLKNKETALKILRSRIYEDQESKAQSSFRTSRLLQVGSSSRNEKIRTFNFKDDRITDHRISKSFFNISSFLEGSEYLDNFLEQLREEFKVEYLLEKLKSIK